MNVGQVCTRAVVSITRSAPLIEVAQLMCEHHVGAVVVVNSQGDSAAPIGILTDRDVVRAQLERVADLSRVQAGDVMTRNPLVVWEDESAGNAIRHMRARGVRRAPVISAGGTLVGLVSTDDLLCQVADEIFDLAHLAARQPREEAPS